MRNKDEKSKKKIWQERPISKMTKKEKEDDDIGEQRKLMMLEREKNKEIKKVWGRKIEASNRQKIE